MSESLRHYLHMPSGLPLPAGEANTTATLFAVVVAKKGNASDVIADWQERLNPKGKLHVENISFTLLEKETPQKVVIETPRSRLAECVRYVAKREEVLWLEEQPQLVTYNSRATKIVQGGLANMANVIWQNGITGRGQIVGIADSGLDYQSAFFHDPSNPVVFCETPFKDGESLKVARFLSVSVR